MAIDVCAASTFVATHGRLLDRRRLALREGTCSADAVLRALDAYRADDGGYGWGLEPDLRSTTSQPVSAMHALEVLVEATGRDAGADGDRGPGLFAWLLGRTLPDGGMPFAVPFSDTAGSAAHWRDADPATSSLQLTAQLAAQGHRLARHRPELADHPWLVGATHYCRRAIRQVSDAPNAYATMFALHFLDAAPASPDPTGLVEGLRPHVVPDGPTPVAGGGAGEALHPLDFAPDPAAPSRSLFTDAAIEADLDRLAAQQQPDGGWSIGFMPDSPAAVLEWRGYATVAALAVLSANGR